MTRRYFLPAIPTVGSVATLDPSESLHAIKVMRVQLGDSVELFDGKGGQAAATVVSITRKECSCCVESFRTKNREPNRELTFAIALPKPDRCREMIERLTELGVKRIVPIDASRTQRGPSTSLIEKLRRAVVEACKQSGRNVLMEIADPVSLGEFLQEEDDAAAKWIAHPDGDAVGLNEIAPLLSVTALVGPEGGWSDDEVNLSIERGFRKVSLGQRIYRIETAAVYLASRLIDS
ncbi:MAG: RsmE family RNA methyltransferase [Pirellulaceae bacterium]